MINGLERVPGIFLTVGTPIANEISRLLRGCNDDCRGWTRRGSGFPSGARRRPGVLEGMSPERHAPWRTRAPLCSATTAHLPARFRADRLRPGIFGRARLCVLGWRRTPTALARSPLQLGPNSTSFPPPASDPTRVFLFAAHQILVKPRRGSGARDTTRAPLPRRGFTKMRRRSPQRCFPSSPNPPTAL
jgi:hypothetical protein